MTTAQTSIEVFGVDIYLVTTKDEWKTLRASNVNLKQLGPPPDSTGRAQWLPPSPAYRTTIAFYVNQEKNDTHHDSLFELLNTCAHEARHGADFVLEALGQRPSDADEVAAYLTGWLTAWLYENCIKEQG